MRYINRKIGKILKEIGCTAPYDFVYDKTAIVNKNKPWLMFAKDKIPAFRLDDVAYWLRDYKGIYINVMHDMTDKWCCFAYKLGYYNDNILFASELFDTYDYALECGVITIVERIKENKL